MLGCPSLPRGGTRTPVPKPQEPVPRPEEGGSNKPGRPPAWPPKHLSFDNLQFSVTIHSFFCNCCHFFGQINLITPV